jgi:hypothetical protein
MATNPIVSKKELEDSGFTNLRDYLNDKNKLTRRGEPIAVRSADPITADSEKGNSRGRPAGMTRREYNDRLRDTFDRDGLGKQMSESGTDMAMAQRDPEATAKFLRSGEMGNGRGSYYKSDGRAVIQKQNEAANEMQREMRGRSDPNAAARAALRSGNSDEAGNPMKRGGAIKKMASGGSVSASRRADGIAQRGKTRGKMC